MTRELEALIGENFYGTLINGLGFRHWRWLERELLPRYQSADLLITSEGVDALKSWSERDLDNLSGIGPVKARRIREALNQLQTHPQEGK